MNLDINAPMVEGVSSVTNKKKEHHTVNKDDSYESYVNTTQIDKAKDELSGQAKGKSEEVSKVFCSLEENEEDVHLRSSWRDERIDDNESDDEDTEEEEDWSDEDEEWLRRQELRDRGLPEVLASLPRLPVLVLRKVILVQDKNSDPIDLTGNTVAGVNPLSQVFNTNSLYIHPQPFH